MRLLWKTTQACLIIKVQLSEMENSMFYDGLLEALEAFCNYSSAKVLLRNWAK